ncbi:MAG: VWA domain-containing protein [Labilithrix sp.]|nr:VWA domain-containing protein [Labilithrix sp.]MCW5812613.1 VWA domain-containing protein [Labilithrix sp.]
MRLLLSSLVLLGFSALSSLTACGTYRGEANGGALDLTPSAPSGASGPSAPRFSRPSLNVSFAVTGQTNAAVASYASVSAATHGTATLATRNDTEAVRRALFPSIVRGQALDVVFVVDTTASMGWAMTSVKSELHAVVTTLAATNPDVRYGVVAFRDRGDSFESKVGFRLDGDQRQVHAAIDWLTPLGGGDYPEHVHAGLDAGLRGAGAWRPQAAHHVVVIGDAPAQDYPDDPRTFRSVTEEARRQQVRVHTVSIACAFICHKELGL